MKKISLLLIFISQVIVAQNSTDALRYSRMNYLGSARYVALGGSMGAVGGDISSLLNNPGGIGIYRSSEFSFGLGFHVNDSKTLFRNSFSQDNQLNLNIGHIGYVQTYKGGSSGWKNYSFAFGYNRMADYNAKTRLSGVNPTSSIIDDYVNTLNEGNANIQDVDGYGYPFGPSQAYWVYMIDKPIGSNYIRTVNQQKEISQKRRIETNGNQNETFFSFGGNYEDRLYLGATMGIQSITYRQKTTFTENYGYDPALGLDSVGSSYTEKTDLLTSGGGFNLKIGAIYKLQESLRLGLAVHTPTFYRLSENYSFKSSSHFSEGTTYDSEEINFEYKYRIRTPMRYQASLAYLFQQRAFINVGVELVDYSSSKINDLRGYEYDYSEVNNDIEKVLTSSLNYTIGMEYNLNPFVLRAGYKFEENPYNTAIVSNVNESRATYSFGSGFRSKNYTIDLSYQYSKLNTIDGVYTTSDAFASTKNQDHNLILSVGWKW